MRITATAKHGGLRSLIITWQKSSDKRKLLYLDCKEHCFKREGIERLMNASCNCSCREDLVLFANSIRLRVQ